MRRGGSPPPRKPESSCGKKSTMSATESTEHGLPKARRAGVNLPPPKTGSAAVRHQAERDLVKARSPRKVSKKRSLATLAALRRESGSTTSPEKLATQARSIARRSGPRARHEASMKAVRSKGCAGLQ